MTRVPDLARVTKSASHCPVGALDYDFPVGSVQFYPEYRADYLRELLKGVRMVLLTPEEADASLSTINAVKVSEDLAARQVLELFRGTYLPL